jgi:hypothetical protein
MVKYPEPLANLLSLFCNVNATDISGLKRQLLKISGIKREKLFRKQLSDAILHGTITPDAYEKLTGEDFDSQDDLKNWLLSLWNELYPGERVGE